MAEKIVIAIALLAIVATLAGDHPRKSLAPLPCPHDPRQLYLPAGEFVMGSTHAEREYAYQLDRERTRAYGWYERETRRMARTGPFCIDRYPVTNADYQTFIKATGRAEPYISADAYRRQGFLVHPYEKVKAFLWSEGSFPLGARTTRSSWSATGTPPPTAPGGEKGRQGATAC